MLFFKRINFDVDPDGRWINEDGSIRPSTTFDYMPKSYKPMFSFSANTGLMYNDGGGGGGYTFTGNAAASMFDYFANGWRQYQSDLGRWFGMDQLSEAYSSFSPYAYVGNKPVMRTDPSSYFGNTGSGWGKTGGYATFAQTPAYKALMSGQTSSITNVNGYLQWTTLDKSDNSMYNDTDGIVAGSTGGIIINRMKVQSSNDTSWDAYKNWADYGSTVIGGAYQVVADQRTALYNSGYGLII
jgi:RHS repeat-associated protein